MRGWFLYMMSNRTHRLYIGSTNDLCSRVREHRERRYPSAFTAQYTYNRLVWFEFVGEQQGTIERELKMKKWHRERKVALIQAMNPEWRDLAYRLDELQWFQE